MEAFILLGTMSFLLLSNDNPTTLQFEEPVIFADVGKVGEISLNFSTDRKIVIIRTLTPLADKKRNMVILTKTNSYNLNLKAVGENEPHHQFLIIRPGARDYSHVLKLETKDYEIREGKRSYFVINKNPNKPLYFNDTEVIRNSSFSKGLPLYYEGKIIVK